MLGAGETVIGQTRKLTSDTNARGLYRLMGHGSHIEKRTFAFERLASAMAPDGWLMLGAGETVIGQTRKLTSDLNARGLYRLAGEGCEVDKRTGHDRRAAARA